MQHRRRGRPRQERPTHDHGTPELALKRALSLTSEALDLCLDRRIITPEQHWCGIHLRWLYTLRFGAPGVRAVDTTHLGGIDIKNDDPKWRSARESEYHEALQWLGERRARLLLGLTVYNERPKLLHRPAGIASTALARRLSDDRADLIEAFDKLVYLWCRKEKINRADV